MNLYLVLLFFVTILYHISTTIPMNFPITYLNGNMPSLQKISCQKDPNHIMCKPLYQPLDNCTQFQLLPLDDDKIELVLIGINGFRSREVMQEYYVIANMNLLYWDPDLAEMAQQYVLRCDLSGVADPTKYIGNETYTIAQTYFFTKIFPYSRWVIEPINSWYMTYSPVNDWRQFSPGAKFTPYTQIIWPTTKFVGCAGARVGEGMLFVCYFGPAADKNNITGAYIQGEPCTRCEPFVTCSNRFRRLCGTDYAGLGNRSNFHFLLIGFVSLRVSISSWDALKWMLF